LGGETDHMETSSELRYQVEDLNRQAVAQVRQGRLEQAETLWLKALDLDPDQEALRGNLARLYFQLGRDADVLRLLLVDACVPDTAALAMLVGQAALRSRRFAVARAAFVRVQQWRPGDPSLALALSQALVGCGCLEEAIACLQDLVSHHSAALEPQLNLAVAYAEAGRVDDALLLLQDLLQRHPGQIAVAINAARLLLQIGDPERASAIIQPLCQQPDSPQSLRELQAEIALALGDHAKARSLWCELLRQDPTNMAARQSLVGLALDLRDFALASSLIEAALRNRQTPPPTRLLSAMADLPPAERSRFAPPEAFDPEQLVQTTVLFVPDDPLLLQIRQEVLRAPSLLADRPGKPTRGGFQSHELLDESTTWSKALCDGLRTQANAYLSQHANHLAWAGSPVKGHGRLSGWGVVLRSGGHQRRHTHPESLLSGVLYLQIPAEMKCSDPYAGALCFSPNPLLAEACHGLHVHPHAGLLVLFPSFLAHETVPFTAAEERICLAFNYC
jgi:uncharacterized protein (TIGR02466 family)